MLRRILTFAAICVLTLAFTVGPVSGAAKQPAWTKNCKALNKKYPHGVGRANASDKVKGKGEPVTTFKRRTQIYKTAVRWNSRLDGDKDGVACEKK